MLLDRQRVRFWQKWIFGIMALLMASFLIFGYSGVLGSCNNRPSGQGSNVPSQDLTNPRINSKPIPRTPP